MPEGNVIVSLARWQSERDQLLARAGKVAVWLKPDDEPELLQQDCATLPLIAVDFPTFRDGRGYSSAVLLRTRYGFTGELRAIGDIARDQLFALARVGFNAFAIREDKDIYDALKAFDDFSEVYSGSVDQPEPLFRRAPQH